jgi:hypothetical protein
VTKKIDCPGGRIHIVTELYGGRLYSVAAFCDKKKADRHFQDGLAESDDQTRFYKDTVPLQ